MSTELLLLATLALASPETPPEPPPAETTADEPEASDPAVRAAVAEAKLARNQELLEAGKEQARLQVDLAELDKKQAEEATARAREETEAAKAELESEKSAKLLEFGLTVGTAFAVQVPVVLQSAGPSTQIRQRTASATAMPYLMLLPGFWTGNGYVRKYCASQWAGKSEATASRAADALAREKAALHLDVLLDAVRNHPTVTLSQLGSKQPAEENLVPPATEKSVQPKDEGEPPSRGLEHLTQAQLDGVKRLLATTDVAEKELLRHALETELMTSVVKWTPGRPARACGWRKIGAWVGIPVKYEARVEGQPFEVAVNAKTELDPVIAFGLGYTPNAYVSVLLGGSYNRVSVASSMSDPEARNLAGLWTLTVGLGVNADILTLLRSK